MASGKYVLTILASYWFLLCLLFNPEAGGDMFFRNVGLLPITTQHYVPEDIKIIGGYAWWDSCSK